MYVHDLVLDGWWADSLFQTKSENNWNHFSPSQSDLNEGHFFYIYIYIHFSKRKVHLVKFTFRI